MNTRQSSSFTLGEAAVIDHDLLERTGWDDVKAPPGGFAGWNSSACPVQKQTAV
jgi:hypothetical protein